MGREITFFGGSMKNWREGRTGWVKGIVQEVPAVHTAGKISGDHTTTQPLVVAGANYEHRDDGTGDPSRSPSDHPAHNLD